MSGGSMNYLYLQLECAEFNTDKSPERVAFAKHLKKVAKALHDIEWVDSCDASPGYELKAIRECIGDAPVLDAAIECAREVADSLRNEIERALDVKRQLMAPNA